jgi:hypothetical protein
MGASHVRVKRVLAARHRRKITLSRKPSSGYTNVAATSSDAVIRSTVDRQTLQIAWAAARREDRRLGGTALEYLSNLVDVFPRLVSTRAGRRS